MLAKVIAHAPTRGEAIDRLRGALMDFHVLGVKTNVAYLLDILDSEGFRSGAFDTGFLGREFGEWALGEPDALVGALAEAASSRSTSPSGGAEAHGGAWAIQDDFRNARA